MKDKKTLDEDWVKGLHRTNAIQPNKNWWKKQFPWFTLLLLYTILESTRVLHLDRETEKFKTALQGCGLFFLVGLFLFVLFWKMDEYLFSKSSHPKKYPKLKKVLLAIAFFQSFLFGYQLFDFYVSGMK